LANCYTDWERLILVKAGILTGERIHESASGISWLCGGKKKAGGSDAVAEWQCVAPLWRRKFSALDIPKLIE